MHCNDKLGLPPCPGRKRASLEPKTQPSMVAISPKAMAFGSGSTYVTKYGTRPQARRKAPHVYSFPVKNAEVQNAALCNFVSNLTLPRNL